MFQELGVDDKTLTGVAAHELASDVLASRRSRASTH